MHLLIILAKFALCSTCLCMYNPAPPSGTEQHPNESPWRTYESDPFTPEEDEFIIKQVCDNPQNKRNIWNEIAEKHQRNVNNKVPGFTKSRTAEKLNRRFNNDLKQISPIGRSEFYNAMKRYSDQEFAFINKELLSDSYRGYRLTDERMWKDILRKHDLKREQNSEGFGAKRTLGGMSYYFLHKMRPAGRVSPEVKARFPEYFETHPESESEAGESSRHGKKPAAFFSPQEDDFIQKAAYTCAQRKEQISWKTLAHEHKRKVETKELGFDTTRSVETLRKRFGILKRKLTYWKPPTRLHAHMYTKQEEDFINKELLNESYRSKFLYDDEIWKALSKKHDLKRKKGCEGFTRERSARSLRTHLMQTMRLGQRVSKDVMARYPRNFGGPQASASTNEEIDPDHDTNLCEDAVPTQEDAGEDYAVFGTIMSELDNSNTMVDADGIDPHLFVDKGLSSMDWQSDLFQPSSEED